MLTTTKHEMLIKDLITNKVDKVIIALLGFSLCLSVLSCKNTSQRGEVLQVEVAGHGEMVCSFDGIVTRLFINDGGQIVVQTRQEPFFSVLSIGGERHVASFGRMGRANGELRSVPQGVNYRTGRLQFLDQSARSFVSLSIPDGTMETRPVPLSPGFRPMKAVEVGDMLIVTGGLDEGRAAYVGPDQSVIPGEEYPFDTGSLSGINRGASLQCDLVCAPDRQMFMIRTMASDCFEIYSVEGKEVKRVFVNEFEYPPVIENSRVDFQRSRAGYIRSFADDANVYLMYSEETYQEASSQGLVSDMIRVYDWDGSLVKKVHLPEKAGAFCVMDDYLFATLEYLDRTEVVRYDLSGMDLQ